MRKKSNKYLVISILSILAISSSFTFPLFYSDNWPERGQIGDSFNIVNSVSTLIASVAAIITLGFYGNQIIEQKEEITLIIQRQSEIENKLSDISFTLQEITRNANRDVKIKSLLNIIELKRIQVKEAKANNLSNTTISNLEIEIGNNLKQLEVFLKSS